MVSMDALSSTLQQYWGVSAFRPLQQEAVIATLEVTVQVFPACSLHTKRTSQQALRQ